MEQNEIKDLIDHAIWDGWHEEKLSKDGIGVPERGTYWLSNRAYYICYRKDGKTGGKYASSYSERACYSSVYNEGFTHGYLYRHDETDEMLPTYLNWLVNESVFKDIFLSKNIDRILEKGFVVDDTKHKGLVLGGLIATRFTWEHANHALVWWELVKAGCNKDYAYIIATSYKGVGQCRPMAQITPSSVNHGGIDAFGWDTDAIRRWMKQNPAKSSGGNSSFLTNRYQDNGAVFTLVPLPKHQESGGRFSSGIKSYAVADFVNHYAAYEEEFIRYVIPDYVSGVKIVIEKPKPPMVEPEGDV